MKTYVLVAALAAASPAWGAPTPIKQAANVVADIREASLPVSGGANPWQAGELEPAASGPWDYTAVDARTNRLLVARMTGVETLDLASLGRAPRTLAQGQHVHAVLPLSENRILFTNGDTATATVVDAGTGALIASIPTGRKPDGALFDPASREVLVMNGDDGTVTRIDVATRKPRLAGQFAVGGKLEAPAIDDAGYLFVNVEDRNAIAIVSLREPGTPVRQVALSGCEAPSGLALKHRSHLLVSACDNGRAVVLDTNGSMVATLPIGRHPDAVIADPDRARVFVPCGEDGTLHEILLDGTPRVGRIWATRPGARTGAFDPRSGRVYLPYGEIKRTEGKPPSLVPASFGVLVVDAR